MGFMCLVKEGDETKWGACLNVRSRQVRNSNSSSGFGLQFVEKEKGARRCHVLKLLESSAAVNVRIV